MKLYLLFFFVLFYASLSSNAQTLPGSGIKVHVSSFKGGRIAALTYSFDDGIQDQFAKAIPMLEKYNLRGTFFIVPTWVAKTEQEGTAGGKVSWPQIKEALKNGHEIGNHSWSHKINLKKANDTILSKEINAAWETIKGRTGIAPTTFAYPWNSFDEHVRSEALKKHIATRDSTIGIGHDMPVEKLNAIIDRTIQRHRWDVIMIHGIEKGYDAFKDSHVLEENFHYAKQHENQLWVGTFSEVVRYVRERNNAKLTIEYKPNQMKCLLKSTLDPTIYNQPLTIVFEVKGVKKIKAVRSGKKLPVVLCADKVCIDWTPGPEPVTVKWE